MSFYFGSASITTGFVSVNVPTSGSKSSTFQLRWGSYISIYLVLCLLFIIPHDPSSSVQNKNQVGSSALKLSPTSLWRGTINSHPAVSPRHATPVAISTLPILDQEHDATVTDEVLRVVRLARKRPQWALRLAISSLRSELGHLATIPSGLARDPTSEAQLAEEEQLLSALAVSLSNGTLGWEYRTTVEGLRETIDGRQNWYGDLSPTETRALYHALLPTELLEDEFEAEGYTLAEKAEIAIAARRAARLYARERALLPYAIGCDLLDGLRQVRRASTRVRPDIATKRGLGGDETLRPC